MTGSLDRGAAAGCLLLVAIVLFCLFFIGLGYYLVKYDWQIVALVTLTLAIGTASVGSNDDALLGTTRPGE